ncbi:hypothetical protein U9M48_042790 [Paspalum notatum var. saurae]|uniref:Uncharacterized protein n=1 Tax=Paspalum notatum var. saurae TaxID=547442 RepID=A0AAQ3XGG8_PASNO
MMSRQAVSSQVCQIRLIANHHDHNAGVSMVTELTKPPLNVVEALPLCDVIYKQCSHCATVVSTCNGTGMVADLQGLGGELDADGGLGVEGEVVARESREDVRLADAAVPDEHHLEQVRVLVIHPPAHLSPLLVGERRRLLGGEEWLTEEAGRRPRKEGTVGFPEEDEGRKLEKNDDNV